MQLIWGDLFPRAEYEDYVKNRGDSPYASRMRQHSLKWIIALNQSENTDLGQIKKLKAKKSEQLTSPYGPHQLTAVHIATMKGKQQVVAALAEAGADPNTLDEYQWTPLHHAALISDCMVQTLLGLGADPDIRTPLGATYQDLAVLSGRQDRKSEQRLFFRDENGKSEIAPQELGLKQYRYASIYPPEQLQKLWKNERSFSLEGLLRSAEASLPVSLDASLIQALGAELPPLIVGKDGGVFAGKKMSARAVIGEYVGEVGGSHFIGEAFVQFFKDEQAKEPYRYFHVNSVEVGNVTRFARDGFPNAMIVRIPKSQGEQVRFVLISITTIKEGDEIVWGRGMEAVALKWGKCPLIRREEMHAFFRKWSIKEVIEKTERIRKKLNNREFKATVDTMTVELLKWNQYLFYGLFTPSALVDLVLQETTTAESWQKAMDREPLASRLIGAPMYLQPIRRVLSVLHDFETHLAKQSDGLAGFVRQFFLEHIRDIAGYQLVHGILRCNRWLSTERSEGEWEEQKKFLETFLSSYDYSSLDELNREVFEGEEQSKLKELLRGMIKK